MTGRGVLALVVLLVFLGGAAWMACSLALEGWRGLRTWITRSAAGQTDPKGDDLRNTRPTLRVMRGTRKRAAL